MKKKLLVAVVASVIGSTAMAQSAFEGAYGQLGIGYENNTVNSSNGTFSGPFTGNGTVPNASNGSFSSTFALGYNFAITKEFLLGIGADYGLTNSGNFESSNSDFDNAQFKVSNRYNIFVTPGYVIDKDKLAYLKAGYSSQTIKLTDGASDSSSYGETVNQSNVNGYVLGLGYKQMITTGFYGFGEVNYYNYGGTSGSKTLSNSVTVSNYSATSSAYQFLVGVGYKF